MPTAAANPYTLSTLDAAPEPLDTLDAAPAAVAIDPFGVSAVLAGISGLASMGLSTWVALDTADEQAEIAQAQSRASQAQSAAIVAASNAAAAESATSFGSLVKDNPITFGAFVLASLGLIAWAVKR